MTDSSATLMINGKLVGCVEEERFTRVKFQSGVPINSINFIKKNNLKYQINVLSVYWDPFVLWKIYLFIKCFY